MIVLPSRIALSGVIGSGKSTFGDLLHEHFHIHPIAFADPLKRAVEAALGMSKNDLWGSSERRETLYRQFRTTGWCFDCNEACEGPERALPLLELDDDQQVDVIRDLWDERPDFWRCARCKAVQPRYATPREALKTLGTNWGRQYCHEMWTTRTFADMKPDESYVVTDCRFHNEREVVRQQGGVRVLLLRNLAESTIPHRSEAEVREAAEDAGNHFNFVLDNRTGTVQENFRRLVDGLRALSDPRRAGVLYRQHAELL